MKYNYFLLLLAAPYIFSDAPDNELLLRPGITGISSYTEAGITRKTEDIHLWISNHLSWTHKVMFWVENASRNGAPTIAYYEQPLTVNEKETTDPYVTAFIVRGTDPKNFINQSPEDRVCPYTVFPFAAKLQQAAFNNLQPGSHNKTSFSTELTTEGKTRKFKCVANGTHNPEQGSYATVHCVLLKKALEEMSTRHANDILNKEIEEIIAEVEAAEEKTEA